MSFSEDYEEIYSLVSGDVSRLFSSLKMELLPDNSLKKSLVRFINMPAKHIRAVISFLYLRAIDADISDKQVDYQTIIELIHNASLIHDDIIDDCDIRRGDKSLRSLLGNHLSVIAGDYILSIVIKKIAMLNSSEILKIFSRTFISMCNGEISQHYDKFKMVTIEDYIEKSYNKTGALFEAAICGAVYLNNGNILDSTIDFSKNFGIAYQIRDDLLNILESRPDSDIENGIYTASVIYSGDPANPSLGIEKAKHLLDNYLGKSKDSILLLPKNEYTDAIIKLIEILRYE